MPALISIQPQVIIIKIDRYMEANSKSLREVTSVQLSDCVTSIAACLDFLAVGCLDDALYVW